MTAQTFEFYSDYARRIGAEFEARGEAKGEARGVAKGVARAVLRALAARGIEVPDDARDRITACTDLDQLDIWVSRAATADAIEELFE